MPASSTKSKSGTYDTLDTYYENREFNKQDMFKTMDLISTHLEAYQRHFLYDRSKTLIKRNTTISYYDITNYFFETKLEDDIALLRQQQRVSPQSDRSDGTLHGRGTELLYFQINPESDNENKHVIAMENDHQGFQGIRNSSMSQMPAAIRAISVFSIRSASVTSS